MGLTPSKHDPNRKAELKRRKASPESFGTPKSHNLPDDWKPSKLASAPKEQAKKQEDKVTTDEELIASIPSMSDDGLLELAKNADNNLSKEVLDASAEEIKKRKDNKE